MKYTKKIHPAFWLRTASFCAFSLLHPLRAAAAQFTGGGIDESLSQAEAINVGGSSDLRETAVSILQAVLSFMGIIAVFVIVISGIMLVVGGGSDESRQKTLKIIVYTLVGLAVILLASALVAFVISVGTDAT